MKTEKITDNNEILAVIIRSEDWQEGLNFISSEQDFMQVGFWGYNIGQKLQAHIHIACPREILRTQEVVFVKKGLVRANIYTEKEELLKSVELKEGDTGVFLAGGHGYEVLQDNTQVLEIKNGPYLGVEKDKKKII